VIPFFQVAGNVADPAGPDPQNLSVAQCPSGDVAIRGGWVSESYPAVEAIVSEGTGGPAGNDTGWMVESNATTGSFVAVADCEPTSS
jgi:hypothetical protein